MATEHCDKVAAGADPGLSLSGKSSSRGPLQTSLQGTSARAMISRKNPDLPHTALSARLVPRPTLFCNSSGTAIAILRASRAYPLARWHRFESIERREHLQGTSARAMVCRKLADLPRTALRARLVPGPTLSCNSSGTAIAILMASRAHPFARWHRFVSIERRQPLQTALQGTSARAVASICVHRASRTPPDSTPGHIDSRDVLQEGHRKVT